ncbi:MAG: trypsin-like serine protease [Ruminococcaceae bacterium]|nr:trypsin-like serine protease [Oscillospiraceae bacterium]
MEIRDYENPAPQSGGALPGTDPVRTPDPQNDAALPTEPCAEQPTPAAPPFAAAEPQFPPRVGEPFAAQMPPAYRPAPWPGAAEPRPQEYSPAAYVKKPHKARTVFFTILALLLAFGLGCSLMFGLIYTGIWDQTVAWIDQSDRLLHDEGRPDSPPAHSDDSDSPLSPPEDGAPSENPDQPSWPEDAADPDDSALPEASFTPIEDAPRVEIITVEPEGENYREELSIPDIAEQATPSVVGVIKYASDDPMDGYGIGSGIVFTEDGYLITNHHVIADAYRVVVLLHDGTEYDAEIIASDEHADIAILKIEAQGLVAAEFGDSTQLRVGEISVAIGCPASIDLQGTTTSGIISALDRVITVDANGRTMRLLQTDAAINPGNSGGPLLNKYGQVIGINTVRLVSTTYEGLCFAIPTSELELIVSDLFTYGYVRGYPAIGLTAASVEEGKDQYGTTPAGVMVAEIDPLGGAYGVVEIGDIITHCNGNRIYAVSQINVIKNRMRVGETITLTVYRSGETFDVEIVLRDQYDLRDDY